MPVWVKLMLGFAAGSAGLLLLAIRTARDSEPMLEQTIKRELESLRERLFDQ
jgi:hypothetical protein